MFEAFVIVCAANFAYEVDYNSCIQLTDDWGPYVTEENCNIRSNQMTDDVLRGDLNPLLFYMFETNGVFADQLYAEGFCTKLPGEDA